MPNDDLGTFPMPPVTPLAPTNDQPVLDSSPLPPPVTPSYSEPIISAPMADSSPVVPPIIPDSVMTPPVPETPPFEETPDEIPSAPEPIPQPDPIPVSSPVETPAVLPPKSGSPIVPIIIIILLLIAGAGIAAAVYLYQQSGKLKAQLTEITQTLNGQETILTPTVSPTIFTIPTPTPSSTASDSGSPTDTPIITNSQFPLKNASPILQVAIKHSPNAKLILIKVDNATDPSTSVIKYFFREDATTKKYFYVAITDKGNPEIIDKQIYVTPDDSIPSLNDHVLTNTLGLDLDEAIRIAYTQCANQAACISAPIKAQYIKTGTGIIWQLSIYTNGSTGTPLMIQINAETKAILYKSPEFSVK